MVQPFASLGDTTTVLLVVRVAEGEKRLNGKNAQNGMKPVLGLDEMTAATRGYVGGRHSLISCISSFLFRFTKPQNHATSYSFHYVLFPPTAVFCGWNSYPIYHGSSREKCPCLSDFWCKEMEESPDSVFQAPGLGWCQPLKEGRQHGGDTGRGPQRLSCSLGPHLPKLGFWGWRRKWMSGHLAMSHCKWYFRALNHAKQQSSL